VVENAAGDTVFTIDCPVVPMHCICCTGRDLEFVVNEILCHFQLLLPPRRR